MNIVKKISPNLDMIFKKTQNPGFARWIYNTISNYFFGYWKNDKV